jgi:signal transduction protein with GAF and PtsI domain
VLALPADGAAQSLPALGDDGPDAVLAPATLASLRARKVLQVTAGDAQADPDVLATLTARGMGSVLMMPVARGGVTVGVLEAYSASERLWSRFEVSRARIVSHQLAAVLDRVEAPAPASAAPRVA